MGKLFEELDFRETPLGDLILQRRKYLQLDGLDVYEVKLGDAFLMSSMFHEVEEALSRLGLAALDGEGWDDFHLRVARVWGEIVAHYQARYASATQPIHLAVVSHGLFLRALLEEVVLNTAQRAEHGDAEGAVAMPNTAVSVLTPLLEGSEFRGVEIERLACTAHLGDTPVLSMPSRNESWAMKPRRKT